MNRQRAKLVFRFLGFSVLTGIAAALGKHYGSKSGPKKGK